MQVCFMLSIVQGRISDLHRKLRFSFWSEYRPVLTPGTLLLLESYHSSNHLNTSVKNFYFQ